MKSDLPKIVVGGGPMLKIFKKYPEVTLQDIKKGKILLTFTGMRVLFFSKTIHSVLF